MSTEKRFESDSGINKGNEDEYDTSFEINSFDELEELDDDVNLENDDEENLEEDEEEDDLEEVEEEEEECEEEYDL